MACFISRRYNCYGPYYPCPISCCSCNCCCSNVVQNPIVVTINLAFLSLTTVTEVASGGVVPVTLVSNVGTAITSTTPGVVNLSAGSYEVSYNVNSLIGSSGTNSFGLQLNGTSVPASISIATGTVGATTTQTNTSVITATSPSTLSLVNLGADTVDVNLANLTIRKIS